MNINIKSNSFSRTSGMVTGIIFLSEKDYYFPDFEWNDSVLFVLNSFLINITNRVSEFEVLYMEVPCEIHITVDYENDSISFIFIDRQQSKIEYESKEKLSIFIKNLSQELNQMLINNTVLNEEEIAKYNNFLSELQKMNKKYHEKLY